MSRPSIFAASHLKRQSCMEAVRQFHQDLVKRLVQGAEKHPQLVDTRKEAQGHVQVSVAASPLSAKLNPLPLRTKAATVTGFGHCNRMSEPGQGLAGAAGRPRRSLAQAAPRAAPDDLRLGNLLFFTSASLG